MTTSFARVRRSTGTVIGPAGGGAAFAAASEGETMKWLRPRPAARLTTAVTAMIQIVRVEPVMALMVGVPSGSSAVPRSASLGGPLPDRRCCAGSDDPGDHADLHLRQPVAPPSAIEAAHASHASSSALWAS